MLMGGFCKMHAKPRKECIMKVYYRNTPEGEEAPLSVDKIVCEKRPERRDALKELLLQLGEGDTLVISSFDQVARSSRDLVMLVARLVEHHVFFVSLQENVNTESEQGQYLMNICQALLDLDEKGRRERQREGIERARSEGKYRGRKRIAVDEAAFSETVERWHQGEITARQAMAELKLKPNTFYRRVKERLGQTPAMNDLKRELHQAEREIAGSKPTKA